MAKGKSSTFISACSRSELGRKADRFFRRFRNTSRGTSGGEGAANNRRPWFSSPVRFIFVLAAIPVLLLFLGLFTYAHWGDTSEGHLAHLSSNKADLLSHLRYLLLAHQSAVVFVSGAVVVLQLLAITGALFNWPTVLFAYVVITGLLGTVVGIVGIFGLVFSLLFGRGGGGGGHKSSSPNDHSRLFTILLVISFILLFYLLTVLGLKLMAYMRRRRGNRSNFEAEEYGGSEISRSKRPYRHSPVARRAKRTSYKSIDAISSPFNSSSHHQVEVDMGGDDDEGDEYNVDYEEDDDDGEGDGQQLSHVYVDSGVPSLSTLLPPLLQIGGKESSSASSSSQRPSSSAASFAFSI